MFYIHKSVLGTERYLLVEEEAISWVHHVPDNSWTYGFSIEESCLRLEDIAKMLKCNLPELVPPSHVNAMNAVLSGSYRIPWRHVFPKAIYNAGLKDLVQSLKHVYSALSDSGYMKTYRACSTFLHGFSRAPVDLHKLQGYLAEEKSGAVVSTLDTFKPRSGQFCDQAYYDIVSTTTGRMIVREGPKILTLPIRYKDILTSDDTSYSMMQVDFISLEPRITLCMNSINEKPDDIYEGLSESIFAGKFTRSQMKIAVLCALYGISARRLSEIIPGSEAQDVIQKVKQYFGVFDKVRSLKQEILKNGFLQSGFGRPLFLEKDEEHLAFSHYIQSTAASAAILGFIELKRVLHQAGIEHKVFFLIHDAAVIEIKKKDYQAIKDICEKGILVDKLGTFPLSFKGLGKNDV